MSTFTRKNRVLAIVSLTAAGVILSGSALADSAKFNGTWSVQLVGSGLCGSGASHVLTILNGSVRAGGSVSVSGQVGSGGLVSLALQRAGVQGSAFGRLSGVSGSGSGSWTVSSLGCSGHWIARRA